MGGKEGEKGKKKTYESERLVNESMNVGWPSTSERELCHELQGENQR